MRGTAKNEDNLDQIYSDLSDEDHRSRRKNSSASPKPARTQAVPIIKGPGGKAFVPPPPPPSSKPYNKTSIPDDILQSRPQPAGFHHPQGQGMRERKSTIFIKNIPKSCNRQQTLTTFFRTFGNIKSIKTNEEQHTATVRFERQQDAYRFMTNKPLILNRSYIIYDTTEDFTVPAPIVQEREKEDVVKVNASEKQVLILKENSENTIADKFRCLLYLKKHADSLTTEQREAIQRQVSICKRIRETESGSRELGEMLMNFENDYDWTLSFRVVTKDSIQKKKVISQYNKYGPIGTITTKVFPSSAPTDPNDQATQKAEDKVGIIKIKYLAVRSSWQMYLDNCKTLGLQVQGSKLSCIFKAWLAVKKSKKKRKWMNQRENRQSLQKKSPRSRRIRKGWLKPRGQWKKQANNDLKINLLYQEWLQIVQSRISIEGLIRIQNKNGNINKLGFKFLIIQFLRLYDCNIIHFCSMSSALSQNTNNLLPENHLTPVSDLSKIFPDIQGELCSRHSTLFGKLKTTFNKLYDNLEPSHYIVVKGNVRIIGRQTDQVELSMGLQNGITILVTKTYPQSNIFINGNHFDEQLILDCKGLIQEGLHELSLEMQAVCASALAGLCEDKLYGGIIYIHANIPEGFYNYKNSLMTALFISMLVINNGLGLYTIHEMITKMSETKAIDQLFLQKQFYDYQNREFSLMVGSTMYKVPLEKDIKLLFCRLDLAHCDIKHSQSNIKEQQEDRERVATLLYQNYGIKSFYEAFESELKIDAQKFRLREDEGRKKVAYTRLIDSELRQLKALCEYSNSNISVEDLVRTKWLIDSKMREYFSEEVVELVESIQLKTGIKACTIVQGQYLMMAVDRRKYTELICMLRQLLHKGELVSKSFFKIEEELIDNRWSSEDSEVGQKIFVSVPSKGIAIFDPSSAIWFD